MTTLTVNWTNLWEAFGVVSDATDTFAAAQPSGEMIRVPGRMGDLIMDDDDFENREVTYESFIYRDMKSNVAALSAFLASLKGYARIEDSAHPSLFRLGRFNGGFAPSIGGNFHAASFDLNFNCKPQKFLKSGESAVAFNASGTIANPTRFASRPLVTVFGSGSVTIGGITITIDTEQTQITIDCETGDAYNGAINCNADVSFSSLDLPKIPAGESNITLDGVTSVSIIPRWYTI